MSDDDRYDEDEAYYASLQGPAYYGTHQGSQRLRGPASRASVPRAFATTPPGMRRDHHQPQRRSERDRYWVNEQPVLRNFVWSTITTKLPEIPPMTEKAMVKMTCLTQFIKKLRNTKGDWMDKTEGLANEFSSMIPNLDAQAETIIDDMDTLDSDIYNYQAGELLDSTYAAVVVGNGANFTAKQRNNIHWYKFAMDVHST